MLVTAFTKGVSTLVRIDKSTVVVDTHEGQRTCNLLGGLLHVQVLENSRRDLRIFALPNVHINGLLNPFNVTVLLHVMNYVTSERFTRFLINVLPQGLLRRRTRRLLRDLLGERRLRDLVLFMAFLDSNIFTTFKTGR